MAEETFKLTRDSGSKFVQEVLCNLLTTGDFSDVTLVCDDQFKFKVHKFILKACSPIFMNMVDEMDNAKTVIYIRGINPLVLKPILEFIYNGKTSFNQDLLEEFVKVAKDLQVKEIIQGEVGNKDNISKGNNAVIPPEEKNNSYEVTVEENIDYDYESFLEIKDIEIDNDDHFNNTNENIPDSAELTKPEVPSDVCHSFTENTSAVTQNVEKENEIANFEKEKQETLDKLVYSPFQCQQCDEVYLKKSQMFKHVKRKHQNMKYFCNECDYQTTRHWSMKMHKEGVHEGIKYPCNRCEYKSTRQSSLIIHIESVHEGIRYSCNKCDHQASTQSYLKEHINAIHEGKKFECKHCDFKTPWRNHLRSHKKSKHLNKQ